MQQAAAKNAAAGDAWPLARPTDAAMATTTEADKIAYCNSMEQIKRRLGLLRTVTSCGLRTGDEGADAEFACLQLRRALELVAFATLAANRQRYSEIRSDVQNEWRAKQILDRLKELNPAFYPVPVTPVRRGGRHVHSTRFQTDT